MGLVEIIPGISASTIAISTRIYQELLYSLSHVDKTFFHLLKKSKLKQAWKHINGSFLITVFAGFFTGFLLLSTFVISVIKHYPIYFWSFFFGIVMMSAPLVLRAITQWRIAIIICCFIGAIFSYSITTLTPTVTSNSLLFIFILGVTIGGAYLLPLFSSALLLMLMHKYQYIINAAMFHHNIIFISFLAGVMIGLLAFSRFLMYLLQNYHNATVALLAGFMIGSLNKLWPWREVMEFSANIKGQQIPASDKSILPWNYFTITGKDPQVFQAILMMALGVFMVVLFEKIAARVKTRF